MERLTINELKMGDIINIKNTTIKVIDVLDDKNIVININDNEKSVVFSKEDLFYYLISLEYGVFTHNCQMRMVCGRLGGIASRMALDDMSATLIDGSHKGAGMIKSQGQVSNVQYYFEKQAWIEDWFTKRGLTPKGWNPGEDPNEAIDPDSIDLGEDEEFTIEESKTEIDFSGIHKTIDNTRSQKFEQI